MKLEMVTNSDVPDALRNSVFTDRARQFIGRHSWDLSVTPEGYEIDEYDDDGSEYLIVHDKGDHLTSCRLRPFSVRTMLLDHFSEIFPNAEPFLRQQSGSLFELTRFLRSPKLTAREGAAALIEFAQGLDHYRDEHGSVGFVAVVYPGVSRFLRQSGVRFLVLDVSTMDGKRVELICLTQAVADPALLDRQRAFGRGETNIRPAPPRRQARQRPFRQLADAI